MTTQSHPLITALSASLADASELEGVPVEEITVERVEAVDWPDACLGVPSEGEACAEVDPRVPGAVHAWLHVPR